MGKDWSLPAIMQGTEAKPENGGQTGSTQPGGNPGGGGGGPKKPQERPIVLRKRRQRVKSSDNWPLFYYQFEQDHAKPNLIWNFRTRQELQDGLQTEIQTFLQDRELGKSVTWLIIIRGNSAKLFFCASGAPYYERL